MRRIHLSALVILGALQLQLEVMGPQWLADMTKIRKSDCLKSENDTMQSIGSTHWYMVVRTLLDPPKAKNTARNGGDPMCLVVPAGVVSSTRVPSARWPTTTEYINAKQSNLTKIG